MSKYRYFIARIPDAEDLDETIVELQADGIKLVETFDFQMEIDVIVQSYDNGNLEHGDEVRTDCALDLWDSYIELVDPSSA